MTQVHNFVADLRRGAPASVRGRVSFETSFVSKLKPKLVSAVSETRRLFRFNIETGSFGVSKQPKQTKDQPKQQQICSNINLFNFPYHKLCFGCFDIGLKHQNKTKQKQPKQIEFRFVSVRTEKKNLLF
jgi:hypothetical protein